MSELFKQLSQVIDCVFDRLQNSNASSQHKEDFAKLLVQLQKKISVVNFKIVKPHNIENFKSSLMKILKDLPLDSLQILRSTSILSSIILHSVNMLTYNNFINDPSHPDYPIFQQIVQFHQFDPVQVQNNLKNFQKLILVGNAIQHRCDSLQSHFFKILAQIFTPAYYYFVNHRRQRRNKQFYNNPQFDNVRKFWNIVQEGLVGNLVQVIMPFIEYNKLIYIVSRPIITQQKINKMRQEDSYNDPQFMQRVYPKENIFHSGSNKLCFRMLCTQNLQKTKDDQQTKVKKVIVQIPGGGFIASSSYSHQFYTRRWANQIQAVVFSIDYKKAPQNPYPCAVDQVFQIYLWIINQGHKYFNYYPEKVVVVGDSAGGNLTAVLTALCIKFGQRLPDNILLYYPALNVSFRAYQPSTSYALVDKFLNQDMLRICVQCYCGQLNDGQLDPFISPNLLGDKILAKFPPTRIFCGQLDALVDQSKIFAVRLKKLGKEVRMKIYKGLPHAFLNFDMPMGLQQSKQCVRQSIQVINDFLS